jgi:moderate conductance mechanosensitive channel
VTGSLQLVEVAVKDGSWTQAWYTKLAALVLVIVLAFVIRWICFKILDRAIKPVAKTVASPGAAKIVGAGSPNPERAAQRAAQRTQTLLSVGRSVVTIVVFSIAIALILGIYGVSLTAILASAGILSVALGFGAQSLVRDYLSGLAIIMEDQYGVGDLVDTGEAVGVVEQVSLRITRLRDASGVIWFVPNGQILRLANRSRGAALVTVDLPIAAGQDANHALSVMGEALSGLADDPQFSDDVLDAPEVVGVESVSAAGVMLRATARTRPDARLTVAREMRARILAAFENAGVTLPLVPPAAPPTGAPRT